MKAVILAGIVLLFGSSVAFASKNEGDCRGNCSRGNNSDHVDVDVRNHSKSDADAHAKASSRAQATAGSVAVNEGNDVVIGPTHIRDGDVSLDAGDTVFLDADQNSFSNSYTHKEVKQAPTVIPGGGNNTASCVKVIGLGGSYSSGDAGGFALGWPRRDKDCALDRAARMAFEMGNAHAGWRLYCAQDSVLEGYYLMVDQDLKRGAKKKAAFEACLQETLVVQGDLEARITEVEATQNVFVEGGTDLTKRVERLESAAHRPRTTTLLVEEDKQHAHDD